MRLLFVDAGGVGDSTGGIAEKYNHFESLGLADIDLKSFSRTVAPEKVTCDKFNSAATENVTQLAEGLRVNAVLCACEPRFAAPIFEERPRPWFMASKFSQQNHFLNY